MLDRVCRKSFWKTPKAALAVLAAVLSITACVTVNVNFPEGAVQKATDDYVRDLYRTKQKESQDSAKPDSAPTSSSTNVFSFFIADAAASADEVFKVSTPESMRLFNSLKGRVSEVIEYKKQGVLGESNDGLLVIQSPDRVKPLLKKKIEKLVQEENKDRSDLYAEVTRANNLSSADTKRISRSFSRSFQAESPSGTWVQSAEGKWEQKP